MDATTPKFEKACQAHLDRYFVAHPDAAIQKQAMKALRMLRSSNKPLNGKPEGWAAGIIYAVATDGHIPCGVPGLLNAEVEQLMGVAIGTARHRAARAMDLVTF